MESKRKTGTGVAIMLTASLLTCTGQLLWKLSATEDSLVLLACGLGLYGGGALLMVVALRFGELSVLHPMLSAGYVLSLFLGAAVLKERISWMKIAGVAVIILGLVLISLPERSEKP